MPAPGEITSLLHKLQKGESRAWDRLARLTYPELHGIAEAHFRDERQGHLLQPTALVNEVWLKFLKLRAVEINDRVHFFCLCSRLMRQILVDHARRRISPAGAGGRRVFGLDGESQEDVLALELALKKLEAVRPRAVQVVEMRYFGGLSVGEIAEALRVSPATIKRDWLMARAWLYGQLHGEAR